MKTSVFIKLLKPVSSWSWFLNLLNEQLSTSCSSIPLFALLWQLTDFLCTTPHVSAQLKVFRWREKLVEKNLWSSPVRSEPWREKLLKVFLSYSWFFSILSTLLLRVLRTQILFSFCSVEWLKDRCYQQPGMKSIWNAAHAVTCTSYMV